MKKKQISKIASSKDFFGSEADKAVLNRLSALSKEEDLLKQALYELLHKGKTVKDIIGADAEQMEALYSIGYSQFKMQNFDMAKNFFQFLAMVDHTNPKYTLAIAACFRMEEQYEQAIVLYHMIMQAHPKYVDAYINICECFFKIEEWESLTGVFKLIEKLNTFQPLSKFNAQRYQVLQQKYQLRMQSDTQHKPH